MAKENSIPSVMIAVQNLEAREMLGKLANDDVRSYGSQVEWLIRQEYARRYSQPQPCITLDEAIERR